MSEPTSPSPTREAVIYRASPSPEAHLAEYLALLDGDPFDPSALGFVRESDNSWFKYSRTKGGSVVATLMKLNYQDGSLPTWALDCKTVPNGDLDRLYQGAIPSNAFALLLLSGIASALHPEEEADFISLLLGNR